MIDEYRELIAPRRATVSPARGLDQAVCKRAQQLVAGAVPEAVVHGLEVVEVDEQHCRRHPVGDVPDRLVHAIGEQRTIGEQRQGIVERERAQLVVQARGIRDVADIQRHAANRLHVAQVGDDHLVGALLVVALRNRKFAVCSNGANARPKTSRTCGASAQASSRRWPASSPGATLTTARTRAGIS